MSPMTAGSLRIIEEVARFRTLLAGLALALGAYTLAAVIRDAPASASDPESTVFVKPIAAIFLVWLTAYLAITISYYRTLAAFACRDVSAAPRVPSARIVQQGHELADVGFSWLGEAEFRFPWQRWKRVWVLVDSTGYASSLLGLQPGISLWTGWLDGSFLTTLTGIPAGIRRTKHSAIVRVMPGAPVGDRYRRHLGEVQTFGAGRTPVRIDSMAEFLATNMRALAPTREALRSQFRPVSVVLMGAVYLMLAWTLFMPAAP